MSETTTALIESVQPKEGVSEKTGKPWKKYVVHTSAGPEYATFDAGLGQVAYSAVGKQARLTFETTRFGRDLTALEVDETAPVHVEPVRDHQDDGAPDWDMIGLRKTRCALWAAYLGNANVQGMPAAAVAAFGREVVLAAEVDIFHRQPADSTADVPF